MKESKVLTPSKFDTKLTKIDLGKIKGGLAETWKNTEFNTCTFDIGDNQPDNERHGDGYADGCQQ